MIKQFQNGTTNHQYLRFAIVRPWMKANFKEYCDPSYDLTEYKTIYVYRSEQSLIAFHF